MRLEEFELPLEVRDYECDIQGIVNNSVYQNYLEHARHRLLKKMGLDFKKLFDEGMVLVVARVNLQYKAPLKNNDRFLVKTTLCQEGLKLMFNQKIIRPADNTLVLKGEITVACTVEGKLCMPELLSEATNKWNNYENE
ncbi:MAG: acyl-CoA thioesterase [Bacteroidales bacterium]